jgi:cbb3-type cytochrome oxidase subunit 3
MSMHAIIEGSIWLAFLAMWFVAAIFFAQWKRKKTSIKEDLENLKKMQQNGHKD